MFGFLESRKERDQKFDEIFWEKRHLIESIAKRYARTPDLIDDLVQEIFLKIYLQLPKVLAADNRDGYLRRLAVNSVVDYFRSHRDKAREVMLSPELEEVLPAPGDGHEADTLGAQRAERFMGMVQALPEKRRNVMTLRIVDELPFRDIGETLGISEVSARNLFSIGMKELKMKILRQQEAGHA